MLNDKEKKDVTDLLSRMDKSDLNSLAQTVTNRLILPETSAEAIQAILLHTDKVSDLLKRRKVRKEFLFKYLNSINVSIDANSDKNVVIGHLLKFWGSSDVQFSRCMPIAGGSSSLISGCFNEDDSFPEAPAPSRNPSYSSLCSLDYGDSLKLKRTSSSHSLAAMLIDDDNEVSSLEQITEMANAFARWFYELINNHLQDLSPLHFFPDASANLTFASSIDNDQASEVVHVFENSFEVVETIRNVIQRFSLKHNPNYGGPGGIVGRIDTYGLVQVEVSGTLHNTVTCCGIFCQQFGLCRDQSESSWKIKYTHSRLISKSMMECGAVVTPSLTAPDTTSEMVLS